MKTWHWILIAGAAIAAFVLWRRKAANAAPAPLSVLGGGNPDPNRPEPWISAGAGGVKWNPTSIASSALGLLAPPAPPPPAPAAPPPMPPPMAPAPPAAANNPPPFKPGLSDMQFTDNLATDMFNSFHNFPGLEWFPTAGVKST